MIFPSWNSRNTAKKAFICPPAGMDPRGTSKSSDPLNFHRYPVVVSYLLLYLKHLARHDLFAPFRPSRAVARSHFLPRGVRRFGNSSKPTSGVRTSFGAAPV